MKYRCNLKMTHEMSKLPKNMNQKSRMTVRGLLSDFMLLNDIEKQTFFNHIYLQLRISFKTIKSESKLLTVVPVSHVVHCDVMSSYILKV